VLLFICMLVPIAVGVIAVGFWAELRRRAAFRIPRVRITANVLPFVRALEDAQRSVRVFAASFPDADPFPE